jgi:hypothetical protein
MNQVCSISALLSSSWLLPNLGMIKSLQKELAICQVIFVQFHCVASPIEEERTNLFFVKYGNLLHVKYL